MAIENANILNVRIRNKYDSYENWATSSLVLDPGEIAIAYTTVNVEVGNGKIEQHPELLMKVGDGAKTFANLPWLSAKAADVAAWAKAANKPTYEAAEITGMEQYISNYVETEMGISVDTNDVFQIVKVDDYNYKLQSKGKSDEAWADVADSVIVIPNDTAAIEALQGLVGDKKVATQISEAIAALDLANTYEAKGEAAKVQTALETYKTTNDAAVLANTNAITANANAITAIKDGTTIDSFADVETALAGKEAAGAAATAEANAKAYADGLADNYDAAGSAAAAETAAKAYADGLAGNYDAAGAAAQALTDAKAYTDAEITEWVGDETVGVQISTAIEALKLDETYDALGAAAAAETAAKSHADGLNTAMDTRVKAVEAKAHEHANKDVLDGVTAEKVAAWDAAEQNAKDYADGLNTTMDGRVADLEAMFGDGEGTVEAQIEAAVAAEAEIARAAEKANADAIDAIEADYLKAADKTALQDQITELDGLVGDKAVSEQITDVTNPLAERVAAIEGDYLVEADKTELQNQITTNANAIERLTNGVSAEEVDGVNDLIAYVKEHGTEVTGMKADIKANADAIDAIEADYLKAADKTELQGNIDTLAGRVTTVEGAVATKAEAADLTALAGRVTTVEGDLNAETTGLKARMTAAEADIDALEGKVGDETVAAQIEAAIEALKIGDYAKAADLTAAIEQHNTDKAALEAEIAKKANTADLADIAFSGSTDDLKQGELVLVFDCGTSAV